MDETPEAITQAITPTRFDEQRFGERIRELRTGRGLSLRGLAQRLGISASALSQIERGKMRPSVTRLYQIMTELDVPMASVFGEEDGGRPPEEPSEAPDTPAVPRVPERVPDSVGGVAVGRREETATLELEHGVRYRRLTPEAVPGMNYFESTYPPGSYSSQNKEYVAHSGHEIGNVISGTLVVDVGFETYELGPGDSIMFPSATPHRISNRGDVPAVAIWLNLG